MANTVIQLKWSDATDTPTSLVSGEAAYSNTTNKLFIGDSSSNVLTIGGKYYTDIIDGATAASTADKLVLRDSSGNFSAGVVTATLYGNANTATTLETARFIKVTGDVDDAQASFDGSANADLTLELTNTGVTAGDYGGTTNIPVFNVDADGRITSAANASITTSLDVAGDTGTDTVALADDTLTFKGNDGITSAVVAANTTVMIDVDNTVIRTTGGQTVSGDMTISGNLTVSGNTVTNDVETLQIEDSLISLANNNTGGDAIDIGFYGTYNDGADKYTAFFRDASDSGKYKIVTGGTAEPTAANSVDPSTYSTGTLIANIEGGTVSGLSSDIAVADGGTGAGTFTQGAILIGNGTNALQTLSNSTYTLTGSHAASKTLTSLTVDAYGRTTAATVADIDINASQVTAGTLPIARGGTNQTSFTNSQRVIFDGTSLASQANTGFTATGSAAASKTITSLTVNDYGETSAVTFGDIDIATTQITSGTLGVARGGTGAASFTVKGVIVSDSSSTTGALSALTSSTEGHVLQINASGVPELAMLNGGQF